MEGTRGKRNIAIMTRKWNENRKRAARKKTGVERNPSKRSNARRTRE